MEYLVSCPFCGNENKINTYDVIRPKDEAFSEIMNGHLTFFKCPNCEKLSPIIKNFIYLDEGKKFVILHKNNEKEFVDLSGFEDKDYLIRIVSNIYELREKIILFNHGLNDRIVELMKVLYKYEVEADIKIDWVERMYIEEDDFNIKLSLIMAGGNKRSYKFNYDIYNRMEELAYNVCNCIDKDEKVIDYNWAIEKINNNEC